MPAGDPTAGPEVTPWAAFAPPGLVCADANSGTESSSVATNRSVLPFMRFLPQYLLRDIHANGEVSNRFRELAGYDPPTNRLYIGSLPDIVRKCRAGNDILPAHDARQLVFDAVRKYICRSRFVTCVGCYRVQADQDHSDEGIHDADDSVSGERGRNVEYRR